jgi:threonylcarbamoyladenosine tRNA methylthiotransferase MtaB
MNRKVAFKTLGCRLNQFETDSIATEFHEAGYSIVDFADPADIYIINTCTVTGQSDKKSRNLISQAVRKENNPLVIVTGCMVNNHKEELAGTLPADYYIENSRKTSIFALAEAHLDGRLQDPGQLRADVFGYRPADIPYHTRSLIKIQDGCDHYCTFCIVPYVRGRAVSRPAGDVLDNIRRVVDRGYREVTLTGVNIGRYRDGDTDFESLIGKILKMEGSFRLRLSSMEPYGFGKGFIELFRHPGLMPHLHLCLQSGSDRVLRRMRRMYSLGEFMELTGRIRTGYEEFNLTTDVMVGFPGETDEDFEMTCRAVKEAGFSHIHTFKYSRRPGTRADRMPGQVPEKVKSQRSEIIRRISAENKLRYRRGLIGKTQEVLVEKVREKQGWGYGELYVPVSFRTDDMKNNLLKTILLTGIAGGEDPELTGKAIE